MVGEQLTVKLPSQKHWKYTYKWNYSEKATEHWQKTSDLQKDKENLHATG